MYYNNTKKLTKVKCIAIIQNINDNTGGEFMIDYTFFEKYHSMNKEDLIVDIDDTLDKILKKAETDPNHSYAFYTTLKNLLDELKKQLDEIILMEKLDKGWCYDWGVSYKGAELQLIHYSLYDGYPDEDPSLINLDQAFTIFTVPSKMLTVEEYALLNGIEVGTARQWIRRGKIRTAKKYGNEWKIPALTDTPKRGYTSARYSWSGKMIGLPKDLEYLNDYCEALFQQDDDDKKLYYVYLYDSKARDGVMRAEKVIECTTSEREKIELAIISQPEVNYFQNFRDNICIDLMNIYNENGGEQE